LGSDHRTPGVHLKLQAGTCKRKRKRTGKRPGKISGWSPIDTEKYKRMLDETLNDALRNEEVEWKMQAMESKCMILENAVRETALLCRKINAEIPKPYAISDNLEQLLRTRRHLTMEGIFSAAERAEVARISKLIQKGFRKLARTKQQNAIAEKLNDFKDLRSITGIRNNGKRRLMASIRDLDGHIRHDQKEVLDVFADFYASLYETSFSDHDDEDADAFGSVARVTAEKVTAALKQMAKKKAADKSGIVVEMLQEGSEFMIELIADMFSDALQQKAIVPENWRESVIRVLFKKGDPQQPGNYRPITLLPIL
jgi:hypothetical protein